MSAYANSLVILVLPPRSRRNGYLQPRNLNVSEDIFALAVTNLEKYFGFIGLQGRYEETLVSSMSLFPLLSYHGMVGSDGEFPWYIGSSSEQVEVGCSRRFTLFTSERELV